MKMTTVQVLKSIYYDPSNPAGFSGINQLYQSAKKVIPSITKKEVYNFLHSQYTYTLHKPFRVKYQRRKTLSRGLDHNWQADLIDLKSIKKENMNYQYILCIIDILSRFVAVHPLRNKTAVETTNGFESILKKTNRIPKKLQTDSGSEFFNLRFRTLLKKYDIIHYSSRSETKASLIERWIRTFKRRLFKYFTYKISLKWTGVLDDMVLSYNTRPHRSINYHTPLDVTKENEHKFWKIQFSNRNKKVIPYVISNNKTKTQSDIKVYKIKKYKGNDIFQPIQKGKPRFKTNQRVRILKWNDKFRKGYIQSFSNTVYLIENIYDTWPYTYSVINETTKEPVEGVFYKEELVGIENE